MAFNQKKLDYYKNGFMGTTKKYALQIQNL
jgi:hypothetical protein